MQICLVRYNPVVAQPKINFKRHTTMCNGTCDISVMIQSITNVVKPTIDEVHIHQILAQPVKRWGVV